MDIEKQIEVLVNNQAAADGRIAKLDENLIRLEAAVASNTADIKILTSNVSQLDKVMDSLAQSMIKINEQSAERDRLLGERIDKLVSGIGEFIRQGGSLQPPA